MSVGRICQREVDLAEPAETVFAASERMLQRKVGTLLILDDKKHPVGILTDRDLVVRVLAKPRSPDDTLVRDVMTSAPQTVTEETAIEDVLAMMKSGEFRRVPVVNDGGELVGLVSLDDILYFLAEEFVMVGQLLERESPKSAGRT